MLAHNADPSNTSKIAASLRLANALNASKLHASRINTSIVAAGQRSLMRPIPEHVFSASRVQLEIAGQGVVVFPLACAIRALLHDWDLLALLTSPAETALSNLISQQATPHDHPPFAPDQGLYPVQQIFTTGLLNFVGCVSPIPSMFLPVYLNHNTYILYHHFPCTLQSTSTIPCHTSTVPCPSRFNRLSSSRRARRAIKAFTKLQLTK